MRKKQIVVIGDSSASAEVYELAYQAGRIIAKTGAVLISGGRGGVMEAASKGAKEEGGIVVAILPDDNFSGANNYTDIVIPTGIGFARNSCNVLSGDIIVAIGGRTGTLSEIAYAWQYNKIIMAFTSVPGWAKELAGRNLDSRRDDRVIELESIEHFEEVLKEYLI